MGLPVSPDRTTGLWLRPPFGGTIDDVMGMRRQAWFDGLAQQRATRPEHQAVEQIEQLEPSDLSARIGMTPKLDPPVAPQHSPRSDGKAAWRKALRES